MKKTSAITAALASTLMLAPLAHAGSANPFAATSLSGGYQLAQADMKPMDAKPMDAKPMMEGKPMDAKPMDGKAMDGKCGAHGKTHKKAGKMADGKCGGKKMDAKCGADKK